MLSDALRQMREGYKSNPLPADPEGMLLALRAFEMEARNMEERLELLTGRPHVALGGKLFSQPLIEISGHEARHVC